MAKKKGRSRKGGSRKGGKGRGRRRRSGGGGRKSFFGIKSPWLTVALFLLIGDVFGSTQASKLPQQVPADAAAGLVAAALGTYFKVKEAVVAGLALAAWKVAWSYGATDRLISMLPASLQGDGTSGLGKTVADINDIGKSIGTSMANGSGSYA